MKLTKIAHEGDIKDGDAIDIFVLEKEGGGPPGPPEEEQLRVFWQEAGGAPGQLNVRHKMDERAAIFSIPRRATPEMRASFVQRIEEWVRTHARG